MAEQILIYLHLEQKNNKRSYSRLCISLKIQACKDVLDSNVGCIHTHTHTYTLEDPTGCDLSKLLLEETHFVMQGRNFPAAVTRSEL